MHDRSDIRRERCLGVLRDGACRLVLRRSHATNEYMTRAIVAATLALGVGLYAAQSAKSSDHQDTMELVSRPGGDITDAYVFPAKDPNDVVFALDVHPLIPAGMGPDANFDPGVMYQFKIDSVGDYREHLVMQFRATGVGPAQKVTFYGPQAPSSAGTTSAFGSPLGETTLGQTAMLPGGIQFFAGARRDPFYFDLTQFFKIDPDRSYRSHLSGGSKLAAADCFLPKGHASNYFANFNVLSLVVELPRAVLTTAQNGGRINVWATASVGSPDSSDFHQVERWGRPAVKEALERFVDHDKTNRLEPYNDPILQHDVYRYMVTPKPDGAGRSPAVAKAMVEVVYPDEMQVNLAANGHATYLGVETKGLSGLPTGVNRIVPDAGLKGFKRSLRNGAREFGGRDLDSPVIDLSLGAIYGTTLSKIGLAHDDHAETDCLTSDNIVPSERALSDFPYLEPAV
jgi:hypothetical protein